MKWLVLSLVVAAALSSHAGIVTWTNTSGGNWNTSANWTPAGPPGAADTAVITNDGTYTVTISADAAVTGITLGGSTGTQTLAPASVTITVNGPLSIRSHGVFQFANDATLSGVATLTGTLHWLSGYLRECNFTVNSDGVLSLSGTGSKALLHSAVNNHGTIRWADSGSLGAISVGGGLLAAITNRAGGVFDIQTDAGFFYNNSGGFDFPFVLHNAGTLRKSAGTGTNVFIGRLLFENQGQVVLDQGAFRFEYGFTNNGIFQLASNTTAHLAKDANLPTATYGFGPSSQKTGGGSLLISSGAITLLGTVPGFDWTGGMLDNSDFTIATNATCTLKANDPKYLRNTILRNAGRLLWTGDGDLWGLSAGGGSYVNITNLAGGEFEIQTDADLNWNSQGGFYFPFVLHNAGLLRKTAGSGETVIPATELTGRQYMRVVNTGTISIEQGALVFPIFDNEGTLTIQNGTAQFPSSFHNNGVLDLASNMVINLAGGDLSFGPNSQVTGEGQLAIPSGDVTLNGSVRNLLWTGGRLVNSTLTIATNGTLTIEGSAEKGIVFSTLNNAGTVRWTGTGNVRAKSAGVTNNTVLITNLPGAVFDFQTDADFLYDDSGGFVFLCAFDNRGTLRKSFGTADSLFPANMLFTSSGQMDLQTGGLVIGDGSAKIGGELLFGITSPTVFGQLSVNVPRKVTVSGIVRARLINPIGLSAGDSFGVLHQGGLFRNKVVFAGRNLGNGLVYDPVVLGVGAVTLVLRAANHPTPPVISLSYAPLLPAFVLVEGQTNSTFRFDASADLSQWTALYTNSAPDGVWEFCDEHAPGFPFRFYRAATQP
ncbi:MAG: hypothetical protein HZA90_20340 [Verrucomicrobia bacterium]|nr:hypothetical protein [Verrucomicrobiota bacterium]